MSLLNVELHCHTHWSKDSLMRPWRLLEVCRRRGIDRVAVTDHNAIAGALEAASLDPERVIVGEEIMTTQGELLAYYVREEIPIGLPPEEAITRLRDQGALISVSHPLDWMRSGSWSERDLRRILPLVDALEVHNARCWWDKPNRRAAALAAEAGLPGTAGSDAHAPGEVGRSGMHLPEFEDAASLRRALVKGEIIRRRLSPFVHLASRYAVWRKATHGG